MNRIQKLLLFIVIIIIIVFLYTRFSSKKNKIAVCTWYDDNIKEYADITSKINQKYCDNNNYDYIVDHTERLPERVKQWEKIPFILKLLNTTKYDYIVWIDADACFRYDHLNQNLLRDIINKNIDKDIILSKDIWESDTNICNSGFMILKNNKSK